MDDHDYQRIWLDCRKPLDISQGVSVFVFDNVDTGFNGKHVGHNKVISPERDTEFSYYYYNDSLLMEIIS